MTVEFIENLDVREKSVLMRVDFNVPIKNAQVLDSTRIKSHLETINWLRTNGAKIVLIGHLGRPNGTFLEHHSFKPVAKELSSLLGVDVSFLKNCIGKEVTTHISQMKSGDICLLENLRMHREEEENNPRFAKELASLTDIYVNDAFGTAHQRHASIIGIPAYQRTCAIGHLMHKELNHVKKVLYPEEKPLVCIIGGAKVSGKIKLMRNLVTRSKMLMVGGAMANTFFASMGYNMGQSFYESEYLDTARRLMTEAAAMGCRILLPVDLVTAKTLEPNVPTRTVKPDEVPQGYQALDIGPATTELWSHMLKDAGMILWNGPMGVIETPPFNAGTNRLIEAITTSNAYKVVGGGDTLLALTEAQATDGMDYISTGGGALIAALEGKQLPAIEAFKGFIKKS